MNKKLIAFLSILSLFLSLSVTPVNAIYMGEIALGDQRVAALVTDLSERFSVCTAAFFQSKAAGWSKTALLLSTNFAENADAETGELATLMKKIAKDLDTFSKKSQGWDNNKTLDTTAAIKSLETDSATLSADQVQLATYINCSK